MIGVSFKGRLGNQLFQYVFIQYLKSRNKGKIIFPPNPHHAYLTKYFNLNSSLDNRLLGSKLFSVITRCLPKIIPFKEVYIQGFVNPKHLTPKNFTIYHGYYQTDWYYNQMLEKPKISIKKKYVDTFLQEFGEVFKTEKTIVVHIRRTDYLTYGKRDISLPIEYFKDQLEAIENLNTYKVFFVSDDIEFVRAAFTEQPNFIYSTNDEITDFQLIMNADISIISNSSFAWWAAFLSTKKTLTIAPKNWIGFRIGAEHPKQIMTNKFSWKEVLISKKPE
ncbi:MAG: alpha-1,2-fucosyltransferase [Pyrinomonadaceae bacterium]|nr:alpha-1,2-fucosyltransferase [Sphingobacteriaceae bacterium]